jgi:Uma2 family endonuclease
MSTANLPRPLIAVEYAEAAHAYLRSLPLEHFMEATAQATQRKITLESLDLVHGRRPDVQVFNELLVQYPRGRQRKPQQVVPDNMVVIWKEPIEAGGSYDVPLQPVSPFWVLEYVSKHNKRKDYKESFRKYERELKVPFYLVFYPDIHELTLYAHSGRKYRAVPPNEHGRLAIPQLDLEVGLLDGWVRFWYQGDLLPLPVELQRDLDEAQRQLRDITRQRDELQNRLEQEQQARRTLEQELKLLRARLREPKDHPPDTP